MKSFSLPALLALAGVTHPATNAVANSTARVLIPKNHESNSGRFAKDGSRFMP